jgi:hypothetical protein
MPYYFVEVTMTVVKEFEVDVDTPQEALKEVYNRRDDEDFNVTIIEEYDETNNIYIYDAYGNTWEPDKTKEWLDELDSKSSMDLL